MGAAQEKSRKFEYRVSQLMSTDQQKEVPEMGAAQLKSSENC